MVDFEPVLRHRRKLLLISGVLVVLSIPGLLRLRIDNSPEGFLSRDARALERFQILERSFGRDRGVRLVLEGEGLWTRRGLEWLAELERRAEEPGGVYGVAGPVMYHRWRGSGPPAADPEGFRELLLADPVSREAGWIDSEGEVLTITTGFFAMPPDRREATLSALEDLLESAPPGVEARAVGIPVINRGLDEAIVTMAVRFFPALFLVAVGLLWLVFRCRAGVLLPLALVGVTETVVLGVMGFAGQRLDVVTILLVPLLFVITLATAVHVFAFHRLRSAVAGFSPVVETYRHKAWPVLWTGLTTAAGFGSLAASGVPTIRALGLWAAFGILFLTLAALSFYPALLASLPVGSDRSGRELRSIDERIGAWTRSGAGAAVAARRRVYAVFALVAILCGVGLWRSRIETNVLTYFRPEHPVRAATEELESRGLGIVTASLVLEDRAGFSGTETLDRLRSLAASLRRDPRIFGVVGIGDVTESLERRRGPELDDEGGDILELMQADADLRRLRAFLLHRDESRTRLLVAVPMRGWEDLEPVFARIESEARRVFPGADSFVTGQYPLILAGQRSLLRTIVVSLLLTLLVIVAILALLIRNLSLTVRALVPNLWPVLFVLGAMGWLGVPVDAATVMIAAVVLGLAVDDTLHILARFRSLAAVQGAAPAAVEAVGQTGSGLVVTSILLSLGFGVCGLSELVPVARFGGVASLGILAALAADLWLVPPLFSTAGPFFGEGGSGSRQAR